MSAQRAQARHLSRQHRQRRAPLQAERLQRLERLEFRNRRNQGLWLWLALALASTGIALLALLLEWIVIGLILVKRRHQSRDRVDDHRFAFNDLLLERAGLLVAFRVAGPSSSSAANRTPALL